MSNAQAAMEFLMTYGWAILVVIVVIGTLAYYGVLNPSSFIPESCTLPLNLRCVDHMLLDKGEMRLNIENHRGEDIRIKKIIAMNYDIFKTNCSFNSSGVLLQNGHSKIFVLNKSNGDGACNVYYTSRKTRWDIKIVWYSANTDESFTHSSFGDLTTSVEKG